MSVVVITGAANGIGLALSQVYLQQENTLVMVDKNQQKLTDEVALLAAQFPEKILAITCDVTQKNEVIDLAKHVKQTFGRVDLLYNNAGIIGQLAPLWEASITDIQQVFDINILGMIHLIQAFTPLLFEQTRRSHIINMASLYALCAGSQTGPYAMSKHAVLALSESLHFDLKRLDKPVDVSIVFPSFTDTTLLTNSLNNDSAFHQILQSLLAHSRPAIEVAQHIVHEVAQKKFYIFPDKEVKDYCEERTNAVLQQENPQVNDIEKLMSALMKRQQLRN